MAVTDGKVTLPTSIGEVAKLLGETSGDLGRVCLSATINKYARCKPVEVKTWAKLTNEQRISANQGLSLPKYNSLSSLREAILADGAKWDYNRPTRYRLTDFEGYNHSTSDWALDSEGHYVFNGSLRPETEGDQIYSGTVIDLWIDYEDSGETQHPLLYPSDWNETSPDNLRAYRLGLAFVNTTTSEVWFRSAYGALGEGYLNVQAIIPAGMANGLQWYLVPVLTDREATSVVNTDFSAIYIPLEGTHFVRTKLAEDPFANLFYTGKATIADGQTSIVVTLRNSTANPITIYDIYFVVSSESAYDSSFATVEAAASTWLVEHQLDDSLPDSGGVVYDGLGRGCQRFYNLLPMLVQQVGVVVIPANASFQFEFTIPATGDDYGEYDDRAYTGFLINDSFSNYDVREFDVEFSQGVSSCFADGYWDNAEPWTDDLGWDNVP